MRQQEAKWRPEPLRGSILAECRYLKETYNVKVYPYGTGHQGVKVLRDFLDRDSNKVNKEVHKRAHEFWVFLMLLEAVLEKQEFRRFEQEHLIGFQPARGAPTQFNGETIANHSFWWEPYLPAYDKKAVIRNYGGRLNFLQEPESLHVKPDLLLFKGDHRTLPFPAMTPWFLEEASSPMLERFKNIASDILWLIECKDYEPEEQDLVRFSWYAAAYRVPSMLIVQGLFPAWFRERFNQDVLTLNQSGIRTEMIDHFDIGKRDYCLSALRSKL